MTDTPHPWSRSTATQAAARRAEGDAGPSLQHRDLPATVERLEERLDDLLRDYTQEWANLTQRVRAMEERVYATVVRIDTDETIDERGGGDVTSITADLAAERSQVEELERAALADDETIRRITDERDAALARVADAERAYESESTARAQAVAELEAAGEPRAWAVVGKGTICGVSVSREDAQSMQREFDVDTTVVPLYLYAQRTPRVVRLPGPWIVQGHWRETYQPWVDEILARRDANWKQRLDAAGVAWEVGE